MQEESEFRKLFEDPVFQRIYNSRGLVEKQVDQDFDDVAKIQAEIREAADYVEKQDERRKLLRREYRQNQKVPILFQKNVECVSSFDTGLRDRCRGRFTAN